MRIFGRPVYLVGVLLFLAGAVALRLGDPFPVQALRLIGFDLDQRIAPAAADPDQPVRIVDIDEASLKAVGQWPWSRTIMASLAQRLADAGAAAVVFDILFSEPDQSSPDEVIKHLTPEQARLVAPTIDPSQAHDPAFAKTLAATPSVLGLSLSTASDFLPAPKAGFAVAGDDPLPFLPGFAGSIANVPVLDEAAKGIGSINWIEDRDLIVRRVPLMFRVGQTFVPSLAAEALRVAQGAGTYVLKASNASGEEAFGRATGLNHIRIGDIAVPTDADGAIWLRFRPSNPASFIPAKSVLDGTMPPEAVAGRIVLIGTSAAGLLDLRATPIDSAVPGVEIHAQVLEHILAGRALTRPDYASGLEIAGLVALGILIAAIMPFIPAGFAALLGLVAIGGLLGGGFLAFDRLGLLFDTLYPVLVLLLLVVGTALYTYRQTERARAGLRRAFQYYVSPDVVDEIIADPARLELGGEVRELTLLFCDVRNFTSLSEGLSAHELTRFINELLTPLSDIILKHRGTIDKYMGDAIMAFWNAPLADPDHARHAIEAARDMLDAMPALNAVWGQRTTEKGLPFPEVRIGIGINTGPCCVGNLGSSQRFDYSAIGDNVNIASRLEGMTKVYGLGVVIGEPTIEAVPDVAAIAIDAIELRGRRQQTRIFTLVPIDADPEFRSVHERYMLALHAGEPELAAHLTRARDTSPARFATYYQLMSERLSNPPHSRETAAPALSPEL